jgi:hypothetical protein
MFLISDNRENCLKSLEKLRRSLAGINCGPVQSVQAGNYWIGWFKCKPSDNFHVFEDGYIVGKINFSEESRVSITA